PAGVEGMPRLGLAPDLLHLPGKPAGVVAASSCFRPGTSSMQNLQAFLAALAVVLTLTFGLLARSVLTLRAWWLLFCVVLTLVMGLITSYLPLILLGLSLLLW